MRFRRAFFRCLLRPVGARVAEYESHGQFQPTIRPLKSSRHLASYMCDICAPSDVVFRHPQFDELSFITDVWGKLLGTQLIGVAITDESHGALYVDALGRHFGANYIDNDVFYFYGASFGEAMDALLLGRRSRPLLRPEQERVALYGEVFAPDHPRVYKYRQSRKLSQK